ncbi:unnamed protein product [Tenebrio molitor]|nr:unnamed protein product [Tenebrio molitor]
MKSDNKDALGSLMTHSLQSHAVPRKLQRISAHDRLRQKNCNAPGVKLQLLICNRNGASTN